MDDGDRSTSPFFKLIDLRTCRPRRPADVNRPVNSKVLLPLIVDGRITRSKEATEEKKEGRKKEPKKKERLCAVSAFVFV